MHRLESIFKTVNAIASKKYDATIEHMLTQAVLSEIDVAKHERAAGYQQGIATISLSVGDLSRTPSLQQRFRQV
ncbi:MAG: hypothetical protein ACJ71Q_11335 [Terriglobales bacterium]